ncbi:PepSY-associated TM helix domain-containing protein [Pelagicoccus albus]|uniref:PepSY domain-containing protein n=1 Tax=Pelagicoccus albus TaxID=415222 RepID=A0A7X1EBI4_9BACT|nr:PepSY-associated TM helix domain-containing protein [Pelagicoccus albus]MBC2607852.1 PepSY domain-containing protein [Pelagicoccus albus]
MRKRLWKLHSWIGLFCAIGLLIIGLSGSVLVFHEEISSALHPDVTLNAPQDEASTRIPTSELTQSVESKFPDFWIRGWLFNTDADKRDRAYVMDRGGDEWHILYVDPYTGETADRPLDYEETLYGWFVQLHYTFFADHIGMIVAAILALGFLFLSVSGIYLHRPFFKAFFRIRWKTSSRIFFSDFHKAIGIASVPFNFILGFTGAYWNISHVAHELIEHSHEEEHEIESPYQEYGDSIDQLATIADQQIAGYALNYIYFPTESDPTFYLYGQHPEAGIINSLYGSTIWISAENGQVKHVTNLKESGWWAKVVDAFEPLHFGGFGGLFTKTLWCLAGLSPAALSITGAMMYFKRKRPKRLRQKPEASLESQSA